LLTYEENTRHLTLHQWRLSVGDVPSVPIATMIRNQVSAPSMSRLRRISSTFLSLTANLDEALASTSSSRLPYQADESLEKENPALGTSTAAVGTAAPSSTVSALGTSLGSLGDRNRATAAGGAGRSMARRVGLAGLPRAFNEKATFRLPP
jgi:hypothetical protein